jgi:hypothetical protein
LVFRNYRLAILFVPNCENACTYFRHRAGPPVLDKDRMFSSLAAENSSSKRSYGFASDSEGVLSPCFNSRYGRNCLNFGSSARRSSPTVFLEGCATLVRASYIVRSAHVHIRIGEPRPHQSLADSQPWRRCLSCRLYCARSDGEYESSVHSHEFPIQAFLGKER